VQTEEEKRKLNINKALYENKISVYDVIKFNTSPCEVYVSMFSDYNTQWTKKWFDELKLLN